jgi:hypothetical protein
MALSELGWEGGIDDESSLMTPSSALSEPESSRRATAGDTTLQDAGSVLPSVRFPSVFMQDVDVSSSESSTSGILSNDGEDGKRRVARGSGDEVLVHRRQSLVGVGVKSKRKTRVWHRRRLKIQEKGLSKFSSLLWTLLTPFPSPRFLARHHALLRSSLCWDSHHPAHYHGLIWLRHARRAVGI